MPHFTHEQQQIMDRDLFPSHIIADYNVQGFDSVESEEFDNGYGCCVHVPRAEIIMPPVPHKELTAHEKWSLGYDKLTDKQKEEMDDKFLFNHGVK